MDIRKRGVKRTLDGMPVNRRATIRSAQKKTTPLQPPVQPTPVPPSPSSSNVGALPSADTPTPHKNTTPSLAQTPPVKETPTPSQTTPASSEKIVDIKIALPTLPQTLKFPNRATIQRMVTRLPRTTRARGVMIVAILVVATYGYTTLHNATTKRTSDAQATNAAPELKKGTPKFATLLPSDKNIDELGGWTRVSPPDSDPVFTYVDNINGQPINVSQQPLPDTLRDDTDEQVKQLAKNFNATEKLAIGDTTAYIGSTIQGPQSVIFTKNGLLILIKSTSKIDKTLWQAYVNLLQ